MLSPPFSEEASGAEGGGGGIRNRALGYESANEVMGTAPIVSPELVEDNAGEVVI
jgi:hypothetical protein